MSERNDDPRDRELLQAKARNDLYATTIGVQEVEIRALENLLVATRFHRNMALVCIALVPVFGWLIARYG